MGLLGTFFGAIGGAKLQRVKPLELQGFFICLGSFR
jgi:hypothetical protein